MISTIGMFRENSIHAQLSDTNCSNNCSNLERGLLPWREYSLLTETPDYVANINVHVVAPHRLVDVLQGHAYAVWRGPIGSVLVVRPPR